MKNTKMIKMEDIRLNPRQERFVKLANKEGFTDKISRKDIAILQAKYGIKRPYWLIKNIAYRCDRGVYKLPSLMTIEEHIISMVKSYAND